MKLKKLITIIMSLALISSFLGCSSKSTNNSTSNSNQEQKQIVLRLSDTHPDGFVTVRADKEFARLVEENSNGRIKVEVYPGGQLGDEKSVIEQVQFGAIDLVRTSISPLAEFDKELSALMLPYLYRDTEHMFRVLDGAIGEKIFKNLENYKFEGLCWFDAGSRNFYNTKKEVKKPDDLKGLKIRVQESKMMMDLVKALGASPTPMAYSEVYSALQTGVIDGAENNWASYLSSNHFEVAKYITTDEHTRVPEVIIMSKITWDKLSADDQKIIKDAAVKAGLYQRQEWQKDEEAAKNQLKDKGVKITTLESNSEFQDKVKVLYDEYGKEYKDLINEIINTK
ncbi:tripartite ATP-independent transporter solute receptor, DctP family [Caloramator quimbayensis]|uniref:Tripartite ATP-independent transporter solute receptor, DctP family n=1 Tax=Caloramator quimbayensis TaxID=1147123 RepID=A0A1T4XXX4_9CLOT|nr:TRAP transporter substrate-binding protein [Caloramator quimbayensis]SKA94068.1 tripartite ATP-independent transporter solute receptor, DctP family [Caloramator quimbayensis]